MSQGSNHLVRGLTLADTTSLVVGTIIGTGIFLKTAVMTRQLGSAAAVMAAWVAAGVLSLAGALTYAELGGLLPKAGGDYVYLRAAYGDAPAFLFGWMRFTVGSAGSIASLAAGFAIFFTALLGIDTHWLTYSFHFAGQEFHWSLGGAQVVAVGAILLLSGINCAGVVAGGRLQTGLTLAKVTGIAIIVFGVFLFSPGVPLTHLTSAARAPGLSMRQAFGAAMLAALWAYDGWNNMPMAAGEVQEPKRNIPRALIGGMLLVLVIYGLVNLAYFHALPVSEIAAPASSSPVATRAVATFLGTRGTSFVAAAIMISILGALNGAILTGARVPYAMARDGLFPRRLGDLGGHSHVPVKSTLVQASWACILALMGTFDQLTDYAVFAMWIFYILTTSSVFVLRRKLSDAERPYRTAGYPFTPLVFILVGVWLLVNTLQTSPLEAGAGLILISLGLPVYFYFRSRHERQRNETKPAG